jgi:hypothetical protein
MRSLPLARRSLTVQAKDIERIVPETNPCRFIEFDSSC